MSRTLFRSALALSLALGLSGCLAAAVGSAAGTAVGVTAKTAVGAAKLGGKAVVATGKAVIPGDGDKDGED